MRKISFDGVQKSGPATNHQRHPGCHERGGYANTALQSPRLLPGATQVSYSGELPLTGDTAGELKCGRLYVNFATPQYLQGEIRGQILPVKPVHEGHPR